MDFGYPAPKNSMSFALVVTLYIIGAFALFAFCVMVVFYVTRLCYRPKPNQRRRPGHGVSGGDIELGSVELATAPPPPPPPPAHPPAQRSQPAIENPFASPFDHDDDSYQPAQFSRGHQAP